MTLSNIQYSVITSFEDQRITADVWNDLLATGSSDVIFMTWQWQKVWWQVFGRGQLLIILCEMDGQPVAIAPLFEEDGMIYLVGSGGSDYLDIIGDVRNPDILKGMLLTAINHVPDFVGFIFYHVPEHSATHKALTNVAEDQNWDYKDEGEMASPMLDMKKFPEHAYEATRKKSLLRHQRWFERNGGIKVEHLTQQEHILPHLNDFFDQHIQRWQDTNYPSLFLQSSQCLFYTNLTQTAAETGWLRFTRVSWQNKPIAFHFGFNYKGSYLWYKPTFDISLANHSPGEVLLRALLLAALDEQAHTFDFGLGDEAFKTRFATGNSMVKNRGLYVTQQETND